MPNAITKFKTYVSMLDEVAANASASMVLDSDSSLVREVSNGREIEIPKMSLTGLADYGRDSGYVNGTVTLTTETVTPDYDRGITFSVDAMSNEETAGVAFGRLASEFTRTKAVPEVDAYRFAKLAGTTGIGTTTAADLTTGADALAAIIAGVSALDDGEIEQNDRYLFVTPTIYNLIMNVDNTKSKAILDGFAGVIKVPQSRFYTAIDLKNGTTDNAFGYTKDANAKNINFMIVSKSAVVQFTKHTVNKAISPEENQTMDAWKFYFRSYGVTQVYANKLKGVYLHKATT